MSRERPQHDYSIDELVEVFEAQSGPLFSSLRQAARKAGFEHAVDLTRVIIDLQAVASIPAQVLRQHKILPLYASGDEFYLAMANPADQQVREEVEFVSGKRVVPCLAKVTQLEPALQACLKNYQEGARWHLGKSFRIGSESVARAPSRKQNKLPEQQPLPNEPTRPAVQKQPEATLGSFDLPPREPPARNAPAATTAPAVQQPAATKKERPAEPVVLIVDDEGDIRKLLARVLSTKKFQVHEASDGLEALKVAREVKPDVMLVDAMLPKLHGFEVCKRIRADAALAATELIVVSAEYRGWRVVEDLRHSFGVSTFLQKPFKVAEVLRAVEVALTHTPNAAKANAEDESIQAHIAQALDAYQSGRVDESIALCEAALERAPDDFGLLFHLGMFLGRQGRVFDGIHVLERAVEQQPKDFAALKNLAILYESAGFQHKAFETWERALGSADANGAASEIREKLVGLLATR